MKLTLRRAPEAERVNVRSRTLLALTIIPLVGIMYLIAGHSSDSPPIFRMPGDTFVGEPLRQVFPQSWGFFTRPADSAMVVPYAVSNASIEGSLSVGTNAEPRFFFGFDRTSRAQAVEITLLLEGIGEEQWVPCDVDATSCLASWATVAGQDAVPVDNHYAQRTICGRVALMAESVTPFLWKDMEPENRIPSEVIVLDVQCADKS